MGAQWIHGTKENPIFKLMDALDFIDNTNGNINCFAQILGTLLSFPQFLETNWRKPKLLRQFLENLCR